MFYHIKFLLEKISVAFVDKLSIYLIEMEEKVKIGNYANEADKKSL